MKGNEYHRFFFVQRITSTLFFYVSLQFFEFILEILSIMQ